MTLTRNTLTFSTRTDSSDSATQKNYTVNATKITNWDNAVTTVNSVKSKTDIIGNTVIGNRTVSDFTSGTSMKNIASFSLTAGTWVVVVAVRFSSNDKHSRAICISTTTTGDAIDPTCLDSGAAYALSNKVTVREVVTILTPTSTTPYYINGYQNSGSKLTLLAQWKCVRIK